MKEGGDSAVLMWQRVLTHSCFSQHITVVRGQHYRLMKAHKRWLKVKGPCAALLTKCLWLAICMKDEGMVQTCAGHTLHSSDLGPVTQAIKCIQGVPLWVELQHQYALAEVWARFCLKHEVDHTWLANM
eukprot:1792304-Amphidinium_carterae.1